jgi:hypothetical protein
MKKIVFAFMVVLIASTAWAVDVTINSAADGNVVTISYVLDAGAPNNIRAFALDITVDACGVIDDVNCLNADYYIYPGSINISGGEVQDYGDCVCNQGDYPSDTLGGIGTQGVTVEMASLYEGDGNAPPASGDLLELTIGGCDDVNVAIAENAIRGGIVLEDPSVDPDVVLNGTQVNLDSCYDGCFDQLHADFAEWQSVGEPDCWCYTYQCEGDADGLSTGTLKDGYFYVTNEDLTILLNAWKKDPLDPGDICADFTRTIDGTLKDGYFRVENADLTVLLGHWKDDASLAGGCGGTMAP